jgi:hypothetical protein
VRPPHAKPGVVVQTVCSECGVTAHWLFRRRGRHVVEADILDHASARVCEHWHEHSVASDAAFRDRRRPLVIEGPVEARRLSR